MDKKIEPCNSTLQNFAPRPPEGQCWQRQDRALRGFDYFVHSRLGFQMANVELRGARGKRRPLVKGLIFESIYCTVCVRKGDVLRLSAGPQERGRNLAPCHLKPLLRACSKRTSHGDQYVRALCAQVLLY